MDILKISIIIPAYNSEKFIEKCLYSCLNQDISHDDYEIIVVDDGSTDNTKNIVLSIQKKYNNIVYIYQENAAQGAARNNGLSKAKGKYIWFVDSDDWIAENCLGNIITQLENKRLTAILVGHASIYKDKFVYWEKLDSNKICSGKEILSQGKFYISPTYGIWNKSYLVNNNIKFIEKIFHEDSEICPRMYYNANKIGFINNTYYFVYTNLSSTTRSINPKRAFDLIKAVETISSFIKTIKEKEIKQSLHNYASILINSSLYSCYSFDKDNISKLEQAWFTNKHLLINLRRSNITKYNLEYWSFKLFPNKIFSVYKFIQLFNKNPGGMNNQKKWINNYK